MVVAVPAVAARLQPQSGTDRRSGGAPRPRGGRRNLAARSGRRRGGARVAIVHGDTATRTLVATGLREGGLVAVEGRHRPRVPRLWCTAPTACPQPAGSRSSDADMADEHGAAPSQTTVAQRSPAHWVTRHALSVAFVCLALCAGGVYSPYYLPSSGVPADRFSARRHPGRQRRDVGRRDDGHHHGDYMFDRR